MSNFESCFIIGTIYRHPSTNARDFTKFLNDIIFKLYAPKLYYFILSDININTSSPIIKSATDYLKMRNSNSAASIITKPTRLTDSSSTTLDHILTNENRYSMMPLVIEYDIPDHYPVMVIISNRLNSRRGHDKPILRRSFAKFSADDFNHELQDRIDDFLDMKNQ